ncbi:hypothetical protein D3C78_870680 [compost metagenome]
MTIGTQCLSIDKGMRQRRQHLLAIGAHEPGADRRGGDLDQQHMIEANAVEGVLQGNHPLDFVSHDHGFQHCPHIQGGFAIGHALLRKVVGHRQDAAEVVRGVPPLGGQPGVVEIEPTDDTTDVPGGLDRVQAVAGARHPRAVRHHGALHQRPQVLGAFREAQRQQAAAQGVHQAVTRRIQRRRGPDLVIQDIVSDILQHPVVVGAVVQINVGTHFTSLCCR